MGFSFAPARPTRTASGVALPLASLVLAYALFDRWEFAVHTPTIDFFTFWSVPHSLSSDPVTNIYEPDGQRQLAIPLLREAESLPESDNQRRATIITARLYGGRVDVTGSPLLYSLVGWLSSGEYDHDQQRFLAISLISFVASIVLLCRLLHFSALEITLILIVFTSFYAPLNADVGVGNMNSIQLFLVASFIALTVRERPFLAGAVLGVAIMLKPNVLLIAAFSLLMGISEGDLRRQLRVGAGLVAAGAASGLASAAFFGDPSVWLAFARSIPRTLSTSYPLENGNFGLAELIFHETHRNASYVVVLVLLAAVGTAIIGAKRLVRRSDGRQSVRAGGGVNDQVLDDAFIVAGVGAAVMLLSSRLAWMHYYVLLAPVILYLIRPSQDDDHDSDHGSLRRVLALAALAVFSPAVTDGILTSQVWEATSLNAAALTMVALSLGELRRQAPSSEVSPPAGRDRGRRRRFDMVAGRS
jgi:hypothetical protein